MEQLECLPYGVGHADEGICLLVQLGPHRVLLDCGLNSIAPLIAERDKLPPADLVLCTHAHPDHARGLLALHQAYPQLPIYASEVTTQLLSLNWLAVALDVPDFCHALPWRSPVEFHDGLTAELFPAGHLPGAAAFLLTYTTPQRTYTLFYTGDFLLSNSRLVDGLPLEELRGLRPDVLIAEGSYGTARYAHRRQQENQLAERIHRAIDSGQSVLLPTPALGLGQELLMLLRSHHHFTGRDIDIWVDGSVSLGCDRYLEMLSHFPSTVQNFARHQPLFWDERIRPRVRSLLDPNLNGKSASLGQLPSIVITDHDADLTRYCRTNTGPWLLLLPVQPGQLGSVEAAVTQTLESSALLRSQVRTGQLKVETYLLSDHCDGTGTTQLIHNLRPQHVVFVHGSPTYLSDLASLEELQNRYHLHTPAVGVRVELPIGETFLQPAAPETKYEGELTEEGLSVGITLPGVIVSDPRWQSFADTGLVEARWQGEELVLRGLTQRELLNQSGESPSPVAVEACETCLHYRGQRCWNQASPLFGFKVTPEGYCPVFEPASLRQNPRADE
ncbi:MBL fold metallo-hydrolase [Thermocoleostomius sinensis]|jgi:Cft2 family RNA processing exonuclease|uniref:MBL fold metallo-hydrolase n=1 Tax=Thermocoleostomius sinensis A174 TaxID=2016057 RepID=A0A9E8ZHG5_9CYAN|nr:MBL fold metallo-hydrolase [Thermocoleostomius sinensis]WAL61889.1 MBL fold metallo-hydrolase [Thermocoleostomius sinensis A174]